MIYLPASRTLTRSVPLSRSTDTEATRPISNSLLKTSARRRRAWHASSLRFSHSSGWYLDLNLEHQAKFFVEFTVHKTGQTKLSKKSVLVESICISEFRVSFFFRLPVCIETTYCNMKTSEIMKYLFMESHDKM